MERVIRVFGSPPIEIRDGLSEHQKDRLYASVIDLVMGFDLALCQSCLKFVPSKEVRRPGRDVKCKVCHG